MSSLSQVSGQGSTVTQAKPASIWKNGYNFALILLVVLGVALIAIGTLAYDNGTLMNVIFVNTGVAMAPAAIVAQLFRVFLFKEVEYELTHPMLDEIRTRLVPEIRASAGEVAEAFEQTIPRVVNEVESIVSTACDDVGTVKDEALKVLSEYHSEIVLLDSLREAGIVRPYRDRRSALIDFATALDSEETEIMVIASSAKGLLQKEGYRVVAEKLQFKANHGVKVKLLLTHPVVADLRARQEGRVFEEIGKEIIASLRVLQQWQIPPDCVKLYCGTPTCFAIKTSTYMLLNPYPYGSEAFESPCLLVKSTPTEYGYFYKAFERAHFGAWDNASALGISSYDAVIATLSDKLGKYAQQIGALTSSF